jgi:RNA polymerase sigma factor (sigma-70 family)
LTPAVEDLTDRQLLERFTTRQDETAFQMLVERYGPLVLGVCERVLNHAQDAEDAFQATFLVLVRKAGSIGKPELLGNWLYGVAYRTAMKAKASAARRSQLERQATPMSSSDPLLDVTWRELRTVLDQELHALPEKYRAPLVLCYFQGKTNEEAARQLGWPPGSMSSRLARGREMLRDRLQSRNRALPAGLLMTVLSKKVGGLTVSPRLVETTVQAAMGFAGKGAAAGVVSPAARSLTETSLKTSRRGRLRYTLAVLLLLLVGSVGVAALALEHLSAGPPSGKYQPPAGDAPVPPCGSGQSK